MLSIPKGIEKEVSSRGGAAAALPGGRDVLVVRQSIGARLRERE
jgi:hypothetical protein